MTAIIALIVVSPLLLALFLAHDVLRKGYLRPPPTQGVSPQEVATLRAELIARTGRIEDTLGALGIRGRM